VHEAVFVYSETSDLQHHVGTHKVLDLGMFQVLDFQIRDVQPVQNRLLIINSIQ
jgi:hypothetical protein